VTFYGEFLEIEPPERITWTFMFDVEGVGPQGGPETVTFEEAFPKYRPDYRPPSMELTELIASRLPQVDLAEGIRRYLDWIRQQGDVKDYFSEAADILRSKGIVHRVAKKS